MSVLVAADSPVIRALGSTHHASGVRTIRLGLVGLGQVGQAVARLVPAASRHTDTYLRFRVAGALVRDVTRARRCPTPARLTTNPAAFLRGTYDLVIEASGTVEPARTMISRLLGRGVPVVTANKALVAAHGEELLALAALRGTTLRYEASALAGVPFLGTLAARPLVSRVQRFAAILNGTSNFILSSLNAGRGSFDEALAASQARGFTEPDPSRDLDGVDSVDKLSLLASLFGWGHVPAHAVDVDGIRGITAEDLSAARSLGGTMKPLVWAERTATDIRVWVAPTLVPGTHPLATLSGALNGIHLSGRFVSDLFFSGPGAGPDVTAATILDDAVEAVTTVQRFPCAPRSVPMVPVVSPETGWFVRARFPGLVPDASATAQIFAGQHLRVRSVTSPAGDARWVRLETASRRTIDAALAAVAHTHRVQCRAFRVMEHEEHGL